MFFSSAITAILPYLLLFGVVSTFFYGISEKIKFISAESLRNPAIHYDAEDQKFAENEQIFYWEDIAAEKDNESDKKKTSHQEVITYHYQRIDQPSEYGSFFFCMQNLKDPVDFNFSLRGPPAYYF